MSAAGKRRHGLRIFFVLSALLIGAFAYWAYDRYTGFADVPLSGLEAGDSVVVESGDSFAKVLQRLRSHGVREGHDIEWQLLARQLDAAGKIQVGEYALDPGITPRLLLVRMRDGKVLSYRFTIVEGWNIRQLRAALAKAKPLRQTVADMDDATLMAKLGNPGQHPEGRFLPETYVYTSSDSDLDVLKRAHSALDKALDAAWQARVAELPLKSKDEALVLASIVEKETGIASERPQIAGVFLRRLKLGMRLQTDPTVIYGMGSTYAGNLRKTDLLADTPYNTYTRDGLPPTPIAMVGADALRAVTQPADGDALFFVAVGDGSGKHVFSKTLAEHEAAVKAYIRRYRAQYGPK